jgi:hypothetical protein
MASTLSHKRRFSAVFVCGDDVGDNNYQPPEVSDSEILLRRRKYSDNDYQPQELSDSETPLRRRKIDGFNERRWRLSMTT